MLIIMMTRPTIINNKQGRARHDVLAPGAVSTFAILKSKPTVGCCHRAKASTAEA